MLLPEAEELLQHKHRLEVFAQTLSEDYIHHARLGLIHPIRSDKVSRLTRSIVRREPGVQLHIQYGMSGEILSRILAKRLHGGFFLGPLNQRTLQSVPLEHIAYSLICHTDDESRLRSGLPRSLNDFTWIEMSGVSGSHKNLQQFWHRHKLTPKKQIICDYPQAIIGLAADGIGLAMVPKHSAQAAQAQGSPIALIDEFEQQLPMSFVYLDEYGQDPALILLRDAVQEVWQTAPPESEAA